MLIWTEEQLEQRRRNQDRFFWDTDCISCEDGWNSEIRSEFCQDCRRTGHQQHLKYSNRCYYCGINLTGALYVSCFTIDNQEHPIFNKLRLKEMGIIERLKFKFKGKKKY
jgi:hypothetical protein